MEVKEENIVVVKEKSFLQKNWLIIIGIILLIVLIILTLRVRKPEGITGEHVYDKIDEKLDSLAANQKRADSTYKEDQKHLLDSIANVEWKRQTRTIIHEKNTVLFIDTASVATKFSVLDSFYGRK